ncbi:MAG TPA: mechanosensitive ion channel family protein [Gammaproteobacteria bacterium]
MNENINQWLNIQVYNNSLLQWLLAIGVALLILFSALFIRYLFRGHIKRKLENQHSLFWNASLTALKKTRWLFLLIIAITFASYTLELPTRLDSTINHILVIAFIIQLGLWLTSILRVSMDGYRQQQLEKHPSSATTLSLLNFIGRLLIWCMVLLLALDNLGVNITALVAGLGVGGIAVALALQTILGDLFSSLSIVLDKPFVIGDFLIVDDLLGTVEYVGLKTTRLRSLSGEQLVFSNSDLLNSRIRNFGRMYERRVPFTIGVTYQTPLAKLKMIPQIIRDAIESQQNTRMDRSNFKAHGDFALLFESVYYVKVPDYNEYMDTQEAINLFIHQRFEEEGIEFAYPTQTLYLKNNPA